MDDRRRGVRVVLWPALSRFLASRTLSRCCGPQSATGPAGFWNGQSVRCTPANVGRSQAAHEPCVPRVRLLPRFNGRICHSQPAALPQPRSPSAGPPSTPSSYVISQGPLLRPHPVLNSISPDGASSSPASSGRHELASRGQTRLPKPAFPSRDRQNHCRLVPHSRDRPRLHPARHGRSAISAAPSAWAP